jgi:hypothetical protein
MKSGVADNDHAAAIEGWARAKNALSNPSSESLAALLS